MNIQKAVKKIRLFLSIFFSLTIILGVFNLMQPSLALAKATVVTTGFKMPIYPPAEIIPCAVDGMGEIVVFEGYMYALFHTVIDGMGGFHSYWQYNPQGVKGIGLTTGDIYQVTGVTREQWMYLPGNGLPYNDTLINNFRIIGVKTGNNLMVKMTCHITVNENGKVTTYFEKISEVCK